MELTWHYMAIMRQAMETLIEDRAEMMDVPSVGDIVHGRIIDKARNALYLDLAHLGVGVIYGRDLLDDSDAFKELKLGDEMKASIQRLDNEDDLIELSIRTVTIEQSWSEIRQLLDDNEIFETEIQDANRGGLIVRVNGITGFLPVSQLAPDHYPRVEGGDKNRILEKLKSYVQDKFMVKVINADQDNEKLIVSEKAAVSDEISEILNKINVDDKVEGTVSGIVDFGIFVKFEIDGNELEGLVHISQLAWQRIDDPADVVGIGDKVKAKVIGIDGLRISLSMKQLKDDPWKGVSDKYKVGDVVEGQVIKVTAFGGFIRLDDDIHGLVHVSELPNKDGGLDEDLLEIGSTKKFKIISLQPENHRLGLSLTK